MIHRKDKDSGMLKNAVLEVECPECGCPNKPGSLRCMYCSSPLPSAVKPASTSFFAKFRGLFASPGRKSKPRSTLFKAVYPAIIALLFLPISIVFLANALKHGGILNWTVASVLALYGGTALKDSWMILVQKEKI
jgi:hypothetical protein